MLPFTLKEVADLLDLQSCAHRKDGAGYYTTCPHCGSHLLHLKFDNGPGGGVYRCVGCGKSGNAAALYAAFKDVNIRKAYHEICQALAINDAAKAKRISATKDAMVNPVQSFCADDETCSDFYTGFLDALTLTQAHEADLKRRGFTAEEIATGTYKSIPTAYSGNPADGDIAINRIVEGLIQRLGKEPEHVPGFYKKGGCWVMYVPSYGGYYVPIRNANGNICALQMRFDKPTRDGAKYKSVSSNPNYETFSSGGTKSLPRMHYSRALATLSDREIDEMRRTIYLTEGPLKAQLAACMSGRVFVGMQGVSATSMLKNELGYAKQRGFDTVATCIDMDKNDNPGVSNALTKVTEIVRGMGFNTREMNWDPRYKGIDDFLLGTNYRERLKTRRRS